MEMVTILRDALASVSVSDVVLLLLRLTAIGAIGHLVLALLHRAPAATRHLAAVATLAVMIATPWLGFLGAAAPALRVPMLEPAPATTPRVPAKLRGFDLGEDVAAVANARAPRMAPAETPAPLVSDLGGDPSAATEPFRMPWHLWPGALALVAILGAWALADLRLLSLFSTAWIARRAHEVADRRLLGLMGEAAATLGLSRHVALRVTDRLGVPAVTGFPRPVLLLPTEALAWNDARLYPVLLHELAHVHRRDEIGFAIARAATALLWFHPLAWTLARVSRQDCERACDDVVIASGVRPSDYADQLLSIARGATGSEKWSSMSLAFARPSSLEGRLLSILRADVRRTPVTRRAAVVVTLVLVALLAPLAAVRVVAEPYAPKAAKNETPEPGTATESVAKMESDWSDSYSVSDPEAITLPEAPDAELGPKWVDLGPAESKSPEEWAVFGRTEYKADRFMAAGEAYERAANAGHNPGMSFYNAACSYSLAGDNNRALGALHASMEHGFAAGKHIQTDADFDPMRSDRRFQMLLGVSKQTELAHNPKKWNEDHDEESVDLDDAQQVKTLAFREMRSGDRDRAAKLFLRQYAIDSTASALYNAACAYAVGGRTEPALRMLERSLHAGYGSAGKLEGDDDLRSIRRTSQFDELVELAEQLELKFPSGAKWDKEGDVAAWKRILPRYERVAREHSNVGRAWFNLGFVQLRANDPEGSHESYLRALALGHRRGTTNYNLACAAAQMGDEDEAIRRLVLAEAAGMDVEQIAPGDGDLDPLRRNSKFRALMDRWDAERGEKKAKYRKAKDARDRELEKELEKTLEKDRERNDG